MDVLDLNVMDTCAFRFFVLDRHLDVWEISNWIHSKAVLYHHVHKILKHNKILCSKLINNLG